MIAVSLCDRLQIFKSFVPFVTKEYPKCVKCHKTRSELEYLNPGRYSEYMNKMTGAVIPVGGLRIFIYVSRCAGVSSTRLRVLTRFLLTAQVEQMLRGEAWSLFRSIAQRNKIAAGALSSHALYTCRTALGANHRFDSSYLCSMLHRMDSAIRAWERDRCKPASYAHKREKAHFAGFSADQIQAIVVLVKRAHEHVDRYKEAVVPLLKKLNREQDPEEHEDVKKLLRGDFDESLTDFTEVGIFTPLAEIVEVLKEDVERLPKTAEVAGSDAPPPDAQRTADESDASSSSGESVRSSAAASSTETQFDPAAVATLKVPECVCVFVFGVLSAY